MTTATQPPRNALAPQSGGNVPAKQASPFGTLRDLLDKSRTQIQMALPKHMTPERMIRVALTAVQRQPALLECEPLSVVGCVIQASELGLELTGPLGQAYMVPYYNSKTRKSEAQFQIGYRGLLRLAFNSGLVSTFNAHAVYAGDEFKFQYGTSPTIHHIPTLTGDRGKIIAVYSVLTLKDETTDFEVMSVAAINEHRARYTKARNGGPWDTAWEEMAKKTVIRRLAKRAPLSAECHLAASLDEYGEAGVSQELGATGWTNASESGMTLDMPPAPALAEPTVDEPQDDETQQFDEHGLPIPRARRHGENQ